MEFPPDLEAVGQARRFLRSTLAAWGCEQYDVGGATVVTELATNAALHAHTSYEVTVRLSEDHLVIEVVDANPRRPRTQGYDSQATTGRGIALVTALSAQWGVRPADAGKVVWAHVRPDDAQDNAWGEWVDLGDEHGVDPIRLIPSTTLPPRSATASTRASGTAQAA
jgi:anti-sigma regulatory factor (Ser/Thr protein kinase)